MLFSGTEMTQRIKSAPCIGFCSTTYGDLVCRGCYRNLNQVLHWTRLSVDEKQEFYDNIAALAKKELLERITITEPNILEEWAGKLLVYSQDPSKRSIFYDLLQALQQGINIVESSAACQLRDSLSPIREVYRKVDQAIYAQLNAEQSS